jgi:ubiquinone/menaquinone biosynthesis C-methylase UbiE
MAARNDFYDTRYSTLSNDVRAAIRREVFGEDIGQVSWLTADDYRTFFAWLDLDADQHVLDVACGSGGPALLLARTVGCRVTGIDQNATGITTATQAAEAAGMSTRVHFRVANAEAPLPFNPHTLDAIVCFSAIGHFSDRLQVLRDWHRLLKPQGTLLYTDPLVVTGPISNEEVARRSAVGFVQFVPLGENEKLLAQSGFRLVRHADLTDKVTRLAERQMEARQRHRDQLIQSEGQERFDTTLAFHTAVYQLTRERRLSKMVYLAEKPAVS